MLKDWLALVLPVNLTLPVIILVVLTWKSLSSKEKGQVFYANKTSYSLLAI